MRKYIFYASIFVLVSIVLGLLLGFRHMRRVTENNVDLNRNFDTVPDLFALQNPGYRTISDMLNPEAPVDLGSLPHRLFAERAVLLIARHGMSALRQAVLQGQYELARGVYFGGRAFGVLLARRARMPTENQAAVAAGRHVRRPGGHRRKALTLPLGVRPRKLD